MISSVSHRGSPQGDQSAGGEPSADICDGAKSDDPQGAVVYASQTTDQICPTRSQLGLPTIRGPVEPLIGLSLRFRQSVLAELA